MRRRLVNFRLDVDARERLAREAGRRRTSVSALLRSWVEERLADPGDGLPRVGRLRINGLAVEAVEGIPVLAPEEGADWRTAGAVRDLLRKVAPMHLDGILAATSAKGMLLLLVEDAVWTDRAKALDGVFVACEDGDVWTVQVEPGGRWPDLL